VTGAGERPYAATTYEVFLATPRSPRQDWHTARLEDLELGVRLAADLQHVLAVIRAIDSGRIPGRQVDWGAWLGPVGFHELRPLLHELGLELPPDADDLDPAAPHFLVAVET
jgi:hypothetical protein